MGSTTGNDVVTNKAEWMVAASRITQQVDLIKVLVSTTCQKATDAGTQANLSAFVQSAELLNILVRIPSLKGCPPLPPFSLAS